MTSSQQFHFTNKPQHAQFGYCIVGMKDPRDARGGSVFYLQREGGEWERRVSEGGLIIGAPPEEEEEEEEGAVLYVPSEMRPFHTIRID